MNIIRNKTNYSQCGLEIFAMHSEVSYHQHAMTLYCQDTTFSNFSNDSSTCKQVVYIVLTLLLRKLHTGLVTGSKMIKLFFSYNTAFHCKTLKQDNFSLAEAILPMYKNHANNSYMTCSLKYFTWQTHTTVWYCFQIVVKTNAVSDQRPKYSDFTTKRNYKI